MWYTYILKCANETYYVGHTQDLGARVEAHNAGEGAAHTKKYRPVKLIYDEEQPTQKAAMERERQLKKWSKAKKEALIKSNKKDLTHLARNRTTWPDQRGWTWLKPKLEKLKGYQLIKEHYGTRHSNRGNRPHIAHIQEGAWLHFHENGWNPIVQEAWCIHPLFQGDDTLIKSLTHPENWQSVQAGALIQTMEYRNIANGYTSKMPLRDPSRILLSPIPEVNQLLMADKLQNRKDYEQYVRPNLSKEEQTRLDTYFAAWFARLNIGEEKYRETIGQLAEAFSL